MRLIIVALLTSAYLAGVVQAADQAGNYAIWGKGRKSCFHYLQDRKTAQEQDRKAAQDDPYKHHIMGYLTAYNAIAPETYSITGNMKLDEVMVWMDDYCESQQMQSVDHALLEFIDDKYKTRQRALPGGGVR